MGTARSRYNLIAPLYDPVLHLVEGNRFGPWRTLLWSKVEGKRVLEVGVGTGRDFPYYPAGAEITAIDLSRSMLNRARRKADRQNITVDLKVMDVQHLDFEDASFDTVVSALVFCAVDDPIEGLTEVRRVLKPGGKLVMMEHVISDHRGLARFMDFMNPVTVFILGENLNRRTAEIARESGFNIENVIHLGGIFRLIEGRKPLLPLPYQPA